MLGRDFLMNKTREPVILGLITEQSLSDGFRPWFLQAMIRRACLDQSRPA